MVNLININKMAKVNFKNSVIALAIGLVTVSCGGSGNKPQSGNASETKTEQAAPAKKVSESGKLPDNHFTKQVPKLDFAINSDGVDVSETRTILRFSDANPSKEQVKAYWEKIKAAGFTKNVLEVDDAYGIQNTASNDAGYSVELTNRSLIIRKQ
jgi:hypothetical protein